MFQINKQFKPCGDQPQAIERLSDSILQGVKSQTLLGVTGSGKTFTMACVIANVKKPTLILTHNKTLAAQLYQEFKNFFPNNAVEYFVSYYDYYQPEAYIPRSDTYIEKEMSINDRIDRMRLSATRSLLERDDVIIVSSISCIYGLGIPEYYNQMKLTLKIGDSPRRDNLLMHLIDMQYSRNDTDFFRGVFRIRGDVLDIFPAYEDQLSIRIEFFGDEIEKIYSFDPLNGRLIENLKTITIFPSSHHVTPEDVRILAIETIKDELKERIAFYENKPLEQERIKQRTEYDLAMIQEIGRCKGIENYSRHFSQRKAGEPPPCLLDYFPKDFLLIIDESHQTIPQAHAMYNGDRARKKSLVDYGFRLMSAYDNRPLKFEEFYSHFNQVIYVSATPGEWEINESNGVIVEQIIRPTGLLDPSIEIKPASGQVDDCLDEIHSHVKTGDRVLVTTLTKRLAEELTSYLQDLNIKAKYLHSDIDTIERVQIIQELRQGHFDVLVGINLLREGLDIPEVSLVAILDADKEGFLRSTTALIQTCGRASRNANGRVIMYGDKITKSMNNTIEITQKRRDFQDQYNKKNNIIPKTIKRDISTVFGFDEEKKLDHSHETGIIEHLTINEVRNKIQYYEQQMKTAAKELRFEDAIKYRDKLRTYQNLEITM